MCTNFSIVNLQDLESDDAKIDDKESDIDDLFKVKRTIVPDEVQEGDEEDEPEKLVFSKNKLKKIKKGGIADGKNKVYFDSSGNKITSFDYHFKGNTFAKEGDEAEADIDQSEYISKVKQSLLANKSIDDQIAGDRIKQKRIKKRKQKEELRKQLEQDQYQVEIGGDDEDEVEEDE